MDIVLVIGRILFAALFIMSGIGHFKNADGMGQYAQAKGVPGAKAGVLISGAIAIIGGLSILLGIYPDLGALLIVLFLVPVSFYMHAFWKETDPMAKQTENISFMKNMALAGGALILFALTVEAGVVQAGLVDKPLF